MIWAYLETLESAFINAKEGKGGFCEDLYMYYNRVLSVPRSEDDAIFVGYAEDLKESLGPALLIFDKLFLIDSIGPFLCSLFKGAEKYPELYGEITIYALQMLERYSFLREYEGLVFVLPPLEYSGSVELLEALKGISETINKSGVLDHIRKLQTIAYRELGIPKYFFDHLKAAYAYGTSVYTSDKRIIGTLERYISLEEALIYANDILGKYRFVSGPGVRTLSREEIEEIRSEYPPNKVRKALREGSDDVPEELRSVSAFYPKAPLISVLYSCIGVSLNVLSVPTPDVITIASSLSSAFKEAFGEERKAFVRHSDVIPGLYRRALARDKSVIRMIRDLYARISGFL